jgi:hypothetical protein
MHQINNKKQALVVYQKDILLCRMLQRLDRTRQALCHAFATSLCWVFSRSNRKETTIRKTYETTKQQQKAEAISPWNISNNNKEEKEQRRRRSNKNHNQPSNQNIIHTTNHNITQVNNHDKTTHYSG